MPYDLFWHGPIAAFEYFVEKAHLDDIRADQQAWAQGLYILDAIVQGIGNKKGIYPAEPYLIKREREQRQNEEDKAVKLYNNLNKWAAGVSARMKAKPPG